MKGGKFGNGPIKAPGLAAPIQESHFRPLAILPEHNGSTHAWMKCFIWIVVLLSAIYCTSALNGSEESAILAIATNFPALASAQPAWTSNASSACDSPGFYGLTCSDGPESHILKLYVDLFEVARICPHLTTLPSLAGCSSNSYLIYYGMQRICD